jgi:thiol-disulfide isomerase/thioredoxin
MRRLKWTCSAVGVGLSLLGGVSLAQQPASQPAAARVRQAVPAPGAVVVPRTQPAATQPTGPQPRIRFDNVVYDFPEAWSGDTIEHDFVFHNDGEGVLELTQVVGTCGCTVVEYDKKTEPGKSGKVKAMVRTAGFKGEVTKTVNVTCNDTKNQVTRLTLHGSLKERLALEPVGGTVNFGRYLGEPLKPQKVKMVSNVDSPVKIEPATPNASKIFKADVAEVQPGKVYEVTVTAEPPYTQGNNYVELQFKTGLKEQPLVSIRCSLFVPPDIEVLPVSIILGMPPTQPMPRPVQIRYNAQGAMKILKAVASDESIKVDLSERTAGKDFQLMVTLPAGFNPPPDKPAMVKVTTDNEKQPEITIPVQMRAQTYTPPAQQRTQTTAEALIGRPAPQVMVQTVDGRGTQIGGGKSDRVTVIDFWASWCKNSRRQLPVIQRVASKLGRGSVDFHLVSVDQQRPGPEVVEIAKQNGISLAILLDSVQQAKQAFGVTGLPLVVVIGKTGTVEAVHRGAGSDEASLKALEETLTAEIGALSDGRTVASLGLKPQPPAAFTMLEVAPPQTAISAPKLSLDSRQQDVGRRKAAETVKYNLRYRNQGTMPLQISSISPSEGVKVDPGFTKSLESGATGMVQVEFATPEKPGEFSKTLTIVSNDTVRSPTVVELSGAVRSLIEVDPPVGVDFSRRPRIHDLPRLATLIYNGQGEIKYGKIESDSPKFRAEIKQVPNAAAYATLTVFAVPPFEPGENKGVLHIQTDKPDQPVVDVPATLFLPPRIEVLPAELTLGPTPRVLQSEISITNNGQSPIHMLEITRSNDKIGTQFYPEPDGASYRLHVTFPVNYVPPAAGDKITIRTDDAQFKEIVIPIKPGGPQAVSQIPPAK